MMKALTIAAAAVLLVAIGAVQRLQPNGDRMYRPIASTGTVGQEVRTLPYSVRVDQVNVARELRVKGFLDIVERKSTKGVWVVVELTATATTEQVRLGDVTLRAANGSLYAATDRFQGFDAVNLEAGIPAAGSIAFELPLDAVKGAVLWITGARYASFHRLNSALGPAAQIELGLTGITAQTITISKEAT